MKGAEILDVCQQGDDFYQLFLFFLIISQFSIAFTHISHVNVRISMK